MVVTFRKNIKLFLKSDNSIKDITHTVIAHCVEVFKSSVRKNDLRFVAET